MNEATLLSTPPRGHAVAANAIAVASGKGGVGKTWLSVTLAQALARQGRRVLLFDGDLGLANVDIQLGLTPSTDLAMTLERDLPLERAVATYRPGGFDVIAGRSGSGSLATIPGPRLQRLSDGLLHLAASYDDVILDLGAGVERNVRHLAAQCGICLVVTTDEPTALTDAYAFIKLANGQQHRGELRIVVNMAGSPAEGERTYATLRKACESFLRIAPPLAGIVRRDPHVKDSIRAQSPILIRHPGTKAAEDVMALARNLIGGP